MATTVWVPAAQLVACFTRTNESRIRETLKGNAAVANLRSFELILMMLQHMTPALDECELLTSMTRMDVEGKHVRAGERILRWIRTYLKR